MNKPSIKISYDAFQLNMGVEDFNDIDNFKAEIDKSYSSLVKANPVGRGGEAYQLIINFFTNLTANDYLTLVGSYLGQKVIDKVLDPILESYVFNPLKEAYINLKKKNTTLDCYSITIELLDTKIYLYSVSPDSLIENKDQILLALDENFKNLIKEEEFPNEIHIPVLEEVIGHKSIYRPPNAETFETKEYNNFFKLWGLKYQYTQDSLVYDIVNKQTLVDTEFMTESELKVQRRMKNKD